MSDVLQSVRHIATFAQNLIMTLDPGIYHLYNRGNNRQRIFFSRENYLYFLRKCHKYLKPYCDILAWCLMPNHFHFLLNITEESLIRVKTGGIAIPKITNGFRLLQSSYAKGINRQEDRTGNLFQQKIKAKEVNQYAVTAFYYIHQNPVMAGLVTKLTEWEFSSYLDFAGLRSGTLCNREKAITLLHLTEPDLRVGTIKPIDEEKIKELF